MVELQAVVKFNNFARRVHHINAPVTGSISYLGRVA